MSELEKPTTDEDIYQTTIQAIIDSNKKSLGKKVAFAKARKAPITLGPEGEVKNYYGEGDEVIKILAQQFEGVWGKAIADNKIRKIIENNVSEEDYEKFPDNLRP